MSKQLDWILNNPKICAYCSEEFIPKNWVQHDNECCTGCEDELELD